MSNEIKKKATAENVKSCIESLNTAVAEAEKIGLKVEITSYQLNPKFPLVVSISESKVF